MVPFPPAPKAGTPRSPAPTLDTRSSGAWMEWLRSMADNAEAAMATAIAYRDLSDEAREAWLDALAEDAPNVNVPRVALYGPLLGVEEDPARRAYLLSQIGGDGEASPSSVHRALVGDLAGGGRILVLILPLYLDFVQLLSCRIEGGHLAEVRHDPIARTADVPQALQRSGSARLEAAPLKAVLDELSLAILAHRRAGRAIPSALGCVTELLGAVGP